MPVIKNDNGDVSLIARNVLMLMRPPQSPVTDSSAQKSSDDEISCAAIPVPTRVSRSVGTQQGSLRLLHLHGLHDGTRSRTRRVDSG